MRIFHVQYTPEDQRGVSQGPLPWIPWPVYPPLKISSLAKRLRKASFPSEYLFEFMSRLFDEAEADSEESEIEFRKKLKKKIRRALKRRCTCVTCSQLFPKRDATKPESHASTRAL